MAIETRILGPHDGHVLDHVAPDVFDDPIDATGTATFLADPRHRLAVAIDDGLVVGFVSAVRYVHPDKARPELWINEVGVAPTHHRRGIARLLLRSVLDEARSDGCSEAWVLTDRTNDAAMRTYASVGGEEHPTDQVMFTFVLDAAEKPAS
jgi:ribosomal protein S18 acetylase RimI-like enzyme